MELLYTTLKQLIFGQSYFIYILTHFYPSLEYFEANSRYPVLFISTWHDHELLIAKFRLKLKKVGKITRPFSYDLNQIPYDYTVEVMNRFKVLDLMDRIPEELWIEVGNIVQEAEKPFQRKRNARRPSLTYSWGKKRSKKQGRKGKIYPIECRVTENSKER